jgi:3-oxoacyl-[acyl-carrier protein] reductase
MAWDGQVAVVTGGSRGIGAAITRLLSKRGAAVAINYMTRSMEAEALRAGIIAAGGRADVADPAAVEAMFTKAQAELGSVSIHPPHGAFCFLGPGLSQTCLLPLHRRSS